MKIQLSLSIFILGFQVWLVQTQQSVAYANILDSISSFVTNIQEVLSGPTELKTLRDARDCGKRNTRENKDSTLAECLWDCEWEDPSEIYKQTLYKKFLHTPIIYDEDINKVAEATHDDPRKLFPDSYVDYIEILYGKEKRKRNFYVDQYMSLPRLPKDTRCLKDCIYPVNTHEIRVRVCVQAAKEWLETDFQLIKDKFLTTDKSTVPLLIFYECMIAFNVETVDDEFEKKQIRRSGKSFSRDYEMLTVEICILAERDYYLWKMSDEKWKDFVMKDGQVQRQGCDEIFFLLYAALYSGRPDILLQGVTGRLPGQTDENNTISIVQNYRDYGQLAKEDIILRTDNQRDENRLTGASIFPTDLGLAINSQHHPWACSLRTRGYRGRHRCGVTLLWGPRKDEKNTHEDPFVLVSAAHCNYICKDRIRGDALETCCCRPPNAEGSCAPNSPKSSRSPFCTGQPVFVLAEPEDVVIICGEFNSAVEIISESREPEQVFTVTKIIQHPNYKPTTDGIGPGSGGPIDGYDIAVYHVIHKEGFMLGENVELRETNNVADDPKLKSSQNYIWPVCLPKDDKDEKFKLGDNQVHPREKEGYVDAMLAGWLDAPPISQAFSNLLGSSLSEADVLKLYYYPRVMGLEEQKICVDPAYQLEKNQLQSTFYPKGTICFKDPSASSCPEFGSSGSGVVRQWAKRNDKKRFSIDIGPCDPLNFGGNSPFGPLCDPYNLENEFLKQQQEDAYQYSFVGPLSMQKGCDNAFHMYTKKLSGTKNNGIGYVSNKLSYRGENPLVVTDARCFMPWIASQYNMKLEKEYDPRDNCKKGEGKSSNVNQDPCYANFLGETKKCDFTLCENINEECTDEKRWNKCRVLAKEGIAFNVNECLVKISEKEAEKLGLPTGPAHYRATCFNNCKGVNPNAITAAGVALVALSGISSTAGLGPGAVGIGGAVLAGREVMNSMNRCGEGCCRMNNRCCRLVPRRGMMVCPRNPRGCRACTS